jgi:hypothetical protein
MTRTPTGSRSEVARGEERVVDGPPELGRASLAQAPDELGVAGGRGRLVSRCRGRTRTLVPGGRAVAVVPLHAGRRRYRLRNRYRAVQPVERRPGRGRRLLDQTEEAGHALDGL